MARLKTARHRRVDAAIRSLANVHSKRMFGADAFFTHERMFAFLFEEAIVLKLPEAERQGLLDAQLARPFLTAEHAPFGRWVEIGLGGPQGEDHAARLATLAHRFAQVPDREGPRKRRATVKRRTAGRRSA